MADASVVSLAERLKQRREERGISQAQAARELDVARTAYRLWELEAAKPAPDRWRLIASWLGISVTTMLLADELVTQDEAGPGSIAAFNFPVTRILSGTEDQRSFFVQARDLIADGVESGDITAEHAQDLRFLVERIEQETSQMDASSWEATELRKSLPSNKSAPRTAREALAFVAADLPTERLDTARLLASELVTNSATHGPSGDSSVGFYVNVERDVLRVEVSDASSHAAKTRTPGDDGGFGLAFVEAMSDRWGSGRTHDGFNLTWFELDLVAPGAA